jgi:hypothetical protein
VRKVIHRKDFSPESICCMTAQGRKSPGRSRRHHKMIQTGCDQATLKHETILFAAGIDMVGLTLQRIVYVRSDGCEFCITMPNLTITVSFWHREVGLSDCKAETKNSLRTSTYY